jgi:predicted amidohydrolase YtcJ
MGAIMYRSVKRSFARASGVAGQLASQLASQLTNQLAASLGLLPALSTLSALVILPGLGHAATLIEHANGYTLAQDGKLHTFQAMLIDDAGKLVAVGSTAELAGKIPGGTQRIDLQGKSVLPGLIDAHGHILDQGLVANELELRAAKTLPEAQKMIADYAKRHPEAAWITGFGWNQVVWQLGRFPTAKEIDAVLADRPVLLERIDGHASWANSRALQLAGIDRTTPDPAGGKIERDASGNPTGVLIDKAGQLVAKQVPDATAAQLRRGLDTALHLLAQNGLTSVHDAGIDVVADGLLREYAQGGKLTTRVYGMIRGVGEDFARLSQNGPTIGFGNDLYTLRAVKLFADGALGSRGAALLRPYADAAHSHGLLFADQAAMAAQVRQAVAKGYQVNVHAIGDAANRQVLDALASLPADLPPPALPPRLARHRVEHAQVVDLADIARFKQLGVIPSMQPVHATSDKNMAEQRVGSERIAGAYAWRSFLAQGSRVACGSDFPIESPNPFWGIHAAVTRQDQEGQPVGGWYPQQAMSVLEALRCFTLDAAYAAHQENSLGSLEAGKWADFIVIDADLFKISPYDLYKIGVLQTWVAGKRVFTRAGN